MPFYPGIITQDVAEQLNDMQDMIARLSQVSGVPPINASLDDSGLRIELSDNGGFMAIITSGSNPYSWTEQDFASSGGYVDKVGGRTGSSNAWEDNGDTMVPSGVIVRMFPAFYDPTTLQNYHFALDAGAGGGGCNTSLCILVPPCEDGTAGTAYITGCFTVSDTCPDPSSSSSSSGGG